MKLIINSNKLPDTYDEEAHAMRMETLMSGGYFIAVYVEERDDGSKYELRVTLSQSDIAAAYASGKRPIDYFVGIDVPALIADFESIDGLGILSRKYESNGDPGAYGEDSTGGPSYGAYQLASAKGSVASFINFLNSAKPSFADALKQAGGDTAARAGDNTFKAAWKKIATDSRAEFFQLQHAFIKTTYYDVFAARLKSQQSLDLASRSLALKNVAWSTAVQHGPRNVIFSNAVPDATVDDEAIIRAVYAERSRVDVHFASSTAAVKQSVRDRFQQELADALAML